MRRPAVIASLIALIPFAVIPAQSVRGVVVDDSTKLPIAEVLVTLIDGSGREIIPGVRSDAGGNFTAHAQRPGTYRVRAVRIGYRPLTSDPVALAVAGLAIVRLRMTTVAQPLVPVRIVERRTLSAAELMSISGFDLRESKGLGTFLSGDRLAALGDLAVGEVLASELRPTLYVHSDSSTFGTLRIRQGSRSCAPEIFLDGRLIAGPLDTIVRFDSSTAPTLFDTVRVRLMGDAENYRVAAAQEYAMSLLSALRASALHGIEVYRSNQILPPSLGGWFGMTKGSIRPCGTVAVWTKNGTRKLWATRGTPTVQPTQVISGTVVNLDTGAPVAGVPVTLLDDDRDAIGDPVESDDRGEFTFRTDRSGEMRLVTANIGYQATTTPAFAIGADEVMIVKLFVSPTRGVAAPLAVAARIRPETFGVTALGGFAYRRERAITGRFFGSADVRRSGATSVGELLRGFPRVSINDSGPAATVSFRPDSDLPSCRPAFYLDGKALGADAERTLAGLPIDGVFGIEVYIGAAEIPPLFADLGEECGLIGIWMIPRG